MDFDKTYDMLNNVRERLEATIPNSSVDLMPSDTDDFFITVTQRNETTGNESKWSFCVDFGDFRITMLEPVEDIEYFGSDNEIFGIIKNFLNGGSSREKRMNRPDYDKGEPIKITGFGNKIGSSKKPIKSSKDPYTYAEAMDKVYKYADKEITNQPIEIIKILDDGKRSGFLTFIFKSGNNTYQMTYDYGFGGEKSGAVIKKVVGGKIESSRKSIKSSYFKPEDVIGYLVGGDEDTITAGDEDEAAAYDTYYYGYGIMDDGEKGHMFIGKYSDVKEFVENYLGLAWSDEFAYPYILSGTEITKYFQNLPSKPLPTEKDYRDFVNQLNKYVVENYETHGNYGPIYVFDMYKGEGTNSDGYGHEYPNFIIYDDEGNLDMHSDDDITEYIRNELKAKGWYPEAVHSSSDFTIAVM